jgi:hypothetical protein
MSGKISAKGAVITVDNSAGSPQTISADIVSFEIQQDASPLDITGFNEGSKNYIPGLPVYGITLDVLWNSTSVTGARTVLQGILGSSTSKTVSVCPEVGGQTISGEFMLDSMPVSGKPDGALTIGSVHFSVMGSVAPTWA